jgi:Tol biopolymer transport system component
LIILVILLSLSISAACSSVQKPVQTLPASTEVVPIANNGNIELVSIDSNGTQGNKNSEYPSISADGHYLVFEAVASNLVYGDTNAAMDVFVHDRFDGETTRVSLTSAGTQGNQGSYNPSISADGRYVAFWSWASNLVGEDTNGTWDVFVHDRITGETQRISVASDGTQGNGRSTRSSISGDGSYVVFDSLASNLVDGDTNGVEDVFVHDMRSGETQRISVVSDGTQGNDLSVWSSISSDGHYLVFESYASNLVGGDTNGTWDVFAHDRVTGETQRISVASDGAQGNDQSGYPVISADGRYVAFSSLATNLMGGDTNGTWDVFVHDRVTGETTCVSIASNGIQGNDYSYGSSISADGRYVAFASNATNLSEGDTNGVEDVFVHDSLTGETTRISVTRNGIQGNNYSYGLSISADGRYIAYTSDATNLVDGDTNDAADVFVHDRGTGK